ncbi:DUF2496 domain-containing protein [Thalassotalea ponticola]|uniref:DUF2496 domain-containing protein n=1 Tax=Thalassotalea ponticola TaxID=1523392 RepID=UPI0025B2BB4B|nr:DUF2496 domain-containing protein [Thalassotalea ponticola]MDN3651996.1 DUF2496 domain-containing protein [Thalassotalea ponticola]
MDDQSMIDNAPDDVKLAIDIIQLLEQNNIDEQLAINALHIVLRDYQSKLAKQSDKKGVNQGQ